MKVSRTPNSMPLIISLCLLMATLCLPLGVIANNCDISIISVQAQRLYYLDKSGFLLVELKVFGTTDYEIVFSVKPLDPTDEYVYVNIESVKDVYLKDHGDFIKMKFLLEVKVSVDGTETALGGCWSMLLEISAKLEQTYSNVEDRDVVIITVCSKDVYDEVLRTNYLSNLERKVDSVIKALDWINYANHELKSRVAGIDSTMNYVLRNLSCVAQSIENVSSLITDVREHIALSIEKVLKSLNLAATNLNSSLVNNLQTSLNRNKEELDIIIGRAEQKLSEELSNLHKIMLIMLGVNTTTIAFTIALLLLLTLKYKKTVEEHELLGL